MGHISFIKRQLVLSCKQTKSRAAQLNLLIQSVPMSALKYSLLSQFLQSFPLKQTSEKGFCSFTAAFGAAGLPFRRGQGAAAPHAAPFGPSSFCLTTFPDVAFHFAFPIICSGAREAFFLRCCGFNFSLQRAAPGSRQPGRPHRLPALGRKPAAARPRAEAAMCISTQTSSWVRSAPLARVFS